MKETYGSNCLKDSGQENIDQMFGSKFEYLLSDMPPPKENYQIPFGREKTSEKNIVSQNLPLPFEETLENEKTVEENIS